MDRGLSVVTCRRDAEVRGTVTPAGEEPANSDEEGQGLLREPRAVQQVPAPQPPPGSRCSSKLGFGVVAGLFLMLVVFVRGFPEISRRAMHCSNSVPPVQTYDRTDKDAGAVVNFEQVISSENDKRDYAVLTLKNNLRVLLISDPETDEAAAAMDVKVSCVRVNEGSVGQLCLLGAGGQHGRPRTVPWTRAFPGTHGFPRYSCAFLVRIAVAVLGDAARPPPSSCHSACAVSSRLQEVP